MFDFISYIRDSGATITLSPAEGMDLITISLEKGGHTEQHTITAQEVRQAANIDIYTGKVLDSLLAKIGSLKAQEYSAMHQSRMISEREDFFRGKGWYDQ